MPLPLEIIFQTYKKTFKKIAYTDLLQKEMVKPSKILGTYMSNDPFKNYWFGMTVNFAKVSATTFHGRIVSRQAK